MAVRQHETKVNVNDVSFVVDHNISIVAVRDLKEVADYRIRRHRLNKISLREVMRGCAFGPEIVFEEFCQGSKTINILLERVNRLGVGNGLNQSGFGGSH